ncbi:2-keto-4-pentenoate hydratase [Dongia sp.]|uniref:2-keto-4-pentenoate hydratase n=1 Tax=Dongia sp. TaxID=1977262 RepID=UPI0037518DB6
MDQTAITRAAELLWRSRHAESRIDALPPEIRPTTLAEGYAIQEAMLDLVQQPAVGWKIAATSAAGQKHIGVTEPLAGRLFRDFVLSDGARRPIAHNHMRVAEAEFAFRMARDLPARGRDYDQGEVMDAVAAMHLAIEVPDARYEVFDTIGAPSICADCAFHAWFLLGPEVSDWRGLDLSKQPVRAWKQDRIVAEGSGANALGDPRIALTWLANHLNRRGLGLKAGEIVTTGTCVKPVDVTAGDTVVMDYFGLGKMSAGFD